MTPFLTIPCRGHRDGEATTACSNILFLDLRYTFKYEDHVPVLGYTLTVLRTSMIVFFCAWEIGFILKLLLTELTGHDRWLTGLVRFKLSVCEGNNSGDGSDVVYL